MHSDADAGISIIAGHDLMAYLAENLAYLIEVRVLGASSLGANAGDGGAPSGGLRDRGLALMNRLVSEG